MKKYLLGIYKLMKILMLRNIHMKNRSINNGFTLIEMMVVVVIIGLITLGATTFFGGGMRSWISGQFQLAAQRDTRIALDRMVKEIREGASIDNSSDSDTIIVKYSVLLGKDTLTYSWPGTSGESLTRKSGTGPSAPFLDNVHQLEFTYLNSVGIIVTNKSNASKILINIQVDLDGDAATGGNPDVILNTEVNLRNFGL
jgi:prepilin-type N-terminal cleavage/methylation domain-containing protein